MAMSRDELTRRAFFNRFLTAGALILSYECGCLNILANPGLCSQLEGKKIRWIVPNAPGGGYDTYSRLIEPFFEKALMAEITIDNIVGAGGMVGAKTIKEADPKEENPIEAFEVLMNLIEQFQNRSEQYAGTFS